MIKKVELLAPAGDLNKLKIAILYGADAVFIGGVKFSLRAKANNFTNEDIKEAVIFANNHQAKVYVTVNIIPNSDDFEQLDEYLKLLDSYHVHAIIVSSIYIVIRAKQLKLRFEVHISTQQSITNSKAIEFFERLGAERVVLARELNMKQLKSIKEKSNIPLEVFIHGGMCSSYSGRCNLSNIMVKRDANKGGCAHSCRWIYKLYKEKQLLGENSFIMASSDLMSIKCLPDLMKMGIDSFKIEGRMKSLHYIATVVSAYRRLIDETYRNNYEISAKRLNYYAREIQKAENRYTTTGFFKKMINDGILFNTGDEKPTQSFIGYVLEERNQDGFIIVEQRNNFQVNSKIEIFTPSGKTIKYKIKKLYDIEDKEIEVARHPQQIVKIKIPFDVPKNSLIRRI